MTLNLSRPLRTSTRTETSKATFALRSCDKLSTLWNSPESVSYFNYNYYHYKTIETVWNACEYDKYEWPNCYMLSCTANKKDPQFAESVTAIAYMSYDEIEKWETCKTRYVFKCY